MNIFTKENFSKYNTKSRTAGIGEWRLRKGVWSMDVRPEPFYKNSYISTDSSGALYDEFKPNTRYVFDFWIDGDNVVYNGKNVPCGFTIYYTDDSTDGTFVVTGGDKGFQHKYYISTAGKSVKYLNIYYSTNYPVFYRWDSSITEFTESKFNKTGVVNTFIKENSDTAQIVNGGVSLVNNIVEN